MAVEMGDVSRAKISVWWDVENCMVPNGVQPHDVVANIRKALRQECLRGPISMAAYADTQRLSHEVQTALTSTGVNLHHIPSGTKDSSDKAMIVDMLLWAVDNPPPAHILLISGDRDFSNAAHRLYMKNYSILLAGYVNQSFSSSLLASSTCVWHWSKLAKGQDAKVSHPLDFHESSAKDQSCTDKIASIPVDALSDAKKTQNLPKLCPVPLPLPTKVKKPKILDTKAQPKPSKVAAISCSPKNPINTDNKRGVSLSNHCPSPTSSARDHLPSGSPNGARTVFLALDILKKEMLAPTVANIEACIQWSLLTPLTFSLRDVLKQAAKIGHIAIVFDISMQTELFIPYNSHLWLFVDPHGCNMYPVELLIILDTWLCSQEARQSLSESKCLYHAALLAREYGPLPLSCLPLAKVANLLQYSGVPKWWLRPTLCSWSPLTIPVDSTIDTLGKVTAPVSSFHALELGPESAEAKTQSQKAVNPDVAKVMKKLRCWLIYILSTDRATGGYNISQLRKDFEAECDVELDLSKLGFSKLTLLLQHFKDVAQIGHGKSNECLIYPANEQTVIILRMFRSWLTGILSTESTSKGFDISLVKKKFELDCNAKLDERELGFGKLQDLVSFFKDVVRLEHPRKGLCLLFPQVAVGGNYNNS